MKSMIPLIMGMAIVTFIPRVFPLLLLADKKTNKSFRDFLTFIPYTSLTILILKGIITSSAEMKFPTIVGIAVASIISYFQGSLVLSIFAAIVSSFFVINFFN